MALELANTQNNQLNRQADMQVTMLSVLESCSNEN